MRVGLLVNPVAGLGGPAALKGSDGTWQEALERGVSPQAANRAARFVTATDHYASVGAPSSASRRISWVTVPGSMGMPAPTADATPPPTQIVLADERFPFGATSSQDTQRAAPALRDAGVDLICFVGGDGTATDVATAVGTAVPCLGVPAGVKVTSPVFAHDPEEAAQLVASLPDRFDTIDRDVTDLDEEAYRAGRLVVRLTGSLRVPMSPFVQGGKVATTQETPLDGIVDMVLRDWDPEALWLVGAGSVGMAVKRRFYGKPTLLGVDAIRGDRIVASDLDSASVRRIVADARDQGRRVHVFLSPIGGQGMLVGRGTQVIPADVLASVGWEALRVAAPPEKLVTRGLWIDSGDPAVDASAPAHIRVVVGWNEVRMVRLLSGSSAHGTSEAAAPPGP